MLVGLTATILVPALNGGAGAQATKIDDKLLVGKWTTEKNRAGRDFYIEFKSGDKLCSVETIYW